MSDSIFDCDKKTAQMIVDYIESECKKIDGFDDLSDKSKCIVIALGSFAFINKTFDLFAKAIADFKKKD